MSVSMRFLDELDILPKNLRQSIAQFMAHVHGSVNDISKVFLRFARLTFEEVYLNETTLSDNIVCFRSTYKMTEGTITQLPSHS